MARKKREDIVNDVKEEALEDEEESESLILSHFDVDDLIPTGSTLLNLALSGHPEGGYLAGTMGNIIGDSHAGKTIATLTTFAEMAQRDRFDNYDLIFDDAEHACTFDIPTLFGNKVATRLVQPKNGPSETIQGFRSNILKQADTGRPFVYVLDSFDAISSDEEVEKAQKVKDGEEVSGSFGGEKPKISGQIFRMLMKDIKQTKSLLLIISQTRDNLNTFSHEKKIRSGGKALKFYATHEIWLTNLKKHKKTVNKQERIIGVDTQAVIKKNKITGKYREVQYPIFYDHGIDNLRSCIDFMEDCGIWVDKGAKSSIPELGFTGNFGKLISHIESENLESVVDKEVTKVWNSIEDSLKLNRKRKYE